MADAEDFRAGDRAGEQRRHPRLRARSRRGRRRVPRRSSTSTSPERFLGMKSVVPSIEGRRRIDHQRSSNGGIWGIQGGGVLLEQVGSARPHKKARPRARQAQHPRELGAPGRRGHADDGCGVRAERQPGGPRTCRWVGSVARRRSRRWSRSSRPTGRATSRCRVVRRRRRHRGGPRPLRVDLARIFRPYGRRQKTARCVPASGRSHAPPVVGRSRRVARHRGRLAGFDQPRYLRPTGRGPDARRSCPRGRCCASRRSWPGRCSRWP